MVQWLRFHVANSGDLGFIPGQGARSYMPQLRPKTQHSQIDKQIYQKVLSRIYSHLCIWPSAPLSDSANLLLRVISKFQVLADEGLTLGVETERVQWP